MNQTNLSPDPRVAVTALERDVVDLDARLRAVEDALFVTTHVAPTKVWENMIRTADGTNWNPGGGAGVYQYRGGTWNKLG